MAKIATNPINNHYIGLPCMLDEVVGRIIGHVDGCFWGFLNSEQSVPSQVLFCTPSGTVISTGRMFVGEITVEGLQKLMKFETELLDSDEELYGGHLNGLLKELNITKEHLGETTNKENPKENQPGSPSIEMTETEKSFMEEIESFLYWKGGNVNVLEIFRKHKKMPD